MVCLLGLAAGPRAAGVALLALLVAAAGFWLGTLAYILGSDAAAEHDADVLAPIFGLTLTAWGAGALVGPPLAGAVADGPGTAAAYAAVAARLHPAAGADRGRDAQRPSTTGDPMTATTVHAPALEAYARDVLAAAGYNDADAAAEAALLVDASLRGVDSHGVLTLLPLMVGAALDGRVDGSCDAFCRPSARRLRHRRRRPRSRRRRAGPGAGGGRTVPPPRTASAPSRSAAAATSVRSPGTCDRSRPTGACRCSWRPARPASHRTAGARRSTAPTRSLP